jgi:hypothetical protein
MKKSTAVTLAISGSLLAGCNDRTYPANGQGYPSVPVLATNWDGTILTNNTYRPGQGYYHSHYGTWYPYPYNFYRPGLGYYHGGNWSSTRNDDRTGTASSQSGSSLGSRSSSGSASHSSHSSVSRGGFGSSGHSSS